MDTTPSEVLSPELLGEAANELQTIRDFIRFTVSSLRAADVHIGHGSEDPFAEAVALMMQTLVR